MYYESYRETYHFYTDPTFLQSLDAVYQTYQRNDVITDDFSGFHQLGIIQSGTAFLVKNQPDGSTCVIDCLTEGDIFGNKLIAAENLDSVYLTARRKTKVCLIQTETIKTLRERNSNLYQSLAEQMFQSLMLHTQAHIEIISGRSIRSKLMLFFQFIHKSTGKREFALPFSLSDLADYIAADRSAMMREIRKLKNESIIESAGQTIILK